MIRLRAKPSDRAHVCGSAALRMEELSPFTEKNTDPKSATYSFNPSRIIGFRGAPMRELGSAENIADANASMNT
jgi:hypothetical protein